jgi:hypothetical protein
LVFLAKSQNVEVAAKEPACSGDLWWGQGDVKDSLNE